MKTKEQLQALADTFLDDLRKREYTADDVEIQVNPDSVDVRFVTRRAGFWDSDDYTISHIHVSLTIEGKIFVQVTIEPAKTS